MDKLAEQIDSVFVKPLTRMFDNLEDLRKHKDEDEIWLYFESFVKIAIKYIHGNRKPVMIRTGSEEMRKYQEESFFGDVDLLSHADKWGVVLEFS